MAEIKRPFLLVVSLEKKILAEPKSLLWTRHFLRKLWSVWKCFECVKIIKFFFECSHCLCTMHSCTEKYIILNDLQPVTVWQLIFVNDHNNGQAGSGSGSIGLLDQEPNPYFRITDPNPKEIITDPQHWAAEKIKEHSLLYWLIGSRAIMSWMNHRNNWSEIKF